MGLMAPSATLMARALALLHQFLAGHEFRVAAEQNVGTAAGHVGGDGDHAEAACLGDDSASRSWNLALSTTCLTPLRWQDGGEALGFFDGGGADQHGLLLLVQLAMSSAAALYFSFSVRIDDVGILNAQHAACWWG